MTADSRSLDDLDPRVADMCRKHQAACTAAGIPFRVTFTYRSMATQDALYAQGRTKPGKIVTNARAGFSYHNFHLAYDATPECLLALPNWGDTPAHQHETDRVWALYGELGKQQGLRWGGDFHSIKDRPHMEASFGLGLAALRAGQKP